MAKAGRKAGEPEAYKQNQHAAVFQDKRTKRQRDRNTQNRIAIFLSGLGD